MVGVGYINSLKKYFVFPKGEYEIWRQIKIPTKAQMDDD